METRNDQKSMEEVLNLKSKGGIDPMALAGLFITLLMLGALYPLLNMFISGLMAETSGAAQYIIQFTPAVIVMSILATFWSYQQTPTK